MNKQLALFCAILVSGMFAAPVHASTPYVSGSIGAMSYSDVGRLPVSGGISLLGAAGLSFDGNRMEVEVGGQSNLDMLVSWIAGYASDLSVTTYLVNASHDFKGGAVEPYLSAGIGYADIGCGLTSSIDSSLNYKASHSAFAYQVSAGAALPLGDNFALDARYRYVGSSTINDEKFGKFSASSNNFLAGIRISF